jgi:hypothetical protein
MHALPRHEQLVGELQQLGISAMATDMWSIKRGTYACYSSCSVVSDRLQIPRPVRKPGSAWGTTGSFLFEERSAGRINSARQVE